MMNLKRLYSLLYLGLSISCSAQHLEIFGASVYSKMTSINLNFEDDVERFGANLEKMKQSYSLGLRYSFSSLLGESWLSLERRTDTLTFKTYEASDDFEWTNSLRASYIFTDWRLGIGKRYPLTDANKRISVFIDGNVSAHLSRKVGSFSSYLLRNTEQITNEDGETVTISRILPETFSSDEGFQYQQYGMSVDVALGTKLSLGKHMYCLARFSSYTELFPRSEILESIYINPSGHAISIALGVTID